MSERFWRGPAGAADPNLDGADAMPGACDHCGGPLDEDAETDSALQTVCGACVEASRREAAAARTSALAA